MLPAARFFDRRRPGLGDEFLDAVSVALQRIRERPFLPPPSAPTCALERSIVSRTPWSIAVEMISSQSSPSRIIHAVADTGEGDW